MGADPATARSEAAGDSASRRELAVARSLDPARARAEKRVQRFLDAALELMSAPDTRDFTVQQVVDRSGQSLRSFYQYFDGKYELLLALFEESVAQAAEQLAESMGGHDDPLERLRAFVAAYYRLCTPPPSNADPASGRTGLNPHAIAEFAQQLLTEHPREATQAFAPLVELLLEVLDEASEVGAIRDDLDNRRVAGVLLQAIMFNAFSATISGTPLRDGDDALLDIVFRGLVTE